MISMLFIKSSKLVPTNPRDIPVKQGAELVDWEGFQSISVVRVTRVVSKLLRAKAAEMEDILPELLQALLAWN